MCIVLILVITAFQCKIHLVIDILQLPCKLAVIGFLIRIEEIFVKI
jgi:hypothetical protein